MINLKESRLPTAFLQAMVVLVAVAALAFLFFEPQTEGVNAHATFFQIYFTDTFLIYAYIASVPFFIALHRTFVILGCIEQGKARSEEVMKALLTIRTCAMASIGFVIIGELFLLSQVSDERPPALFMGMLIVLGSLTAAALSLTLERMLKNTAK